MPSYNLENIKFLVVDDNKHMVALIRSILRVFNCRNICEASNGLDALKELKIFHADVIICDWSMSPLNGGEFTRIVRNSKDSPNPFVPIIMLTAHTERDRVKEARDLGVNEFLAKPISPKEMYAKIHSIIDSPRPFVRSESYFGPDRRRKNCDDYNGVERRKGNLIKKANEGLSVNILDTLSKNDG